MIVCFQLQNSKRGFGTKTDRLLITALKFYSEHKIYLHYLKKILVSLFSQKKIFFSF